MQDDESESYGFNITPEERERFSPPESGGKGDAFLKGGCGCLAAFFVIGFVAVMLGGRMHIDAGGAICIFGIGGVLGLIMLAIYNAGLRDGRD